MGKLGKDQVINSSINFPYQPYQQIGCIPGDVKNLVTHTHTKCIQYTFLLQNCCCKHNIRIQTTFRVSALSDIQIISY